MSKFIRNYDPNGRAVMLNGEVPWNQENEISGNLRSICRQSLSAIRLLALKMVPAKPQPEVLLISTQTSQPSNTHQQKYPQQFVGINTIC